MAFDALGPGWFAIGNRMRVKCGPITLGVNLPRSRAEIRAALSCSAGTRRRFHSGIRAHQAALIAADGARPPQISDVSF